MNTPTPEYTRDAVWGPMSHPATDTIDAGLAPWKDHIYIAFWDDKNAVYGFFHWNSSPNHNTGKAQLTVLAKGKFFNLKEFQPASTTHFASESFDFDMRGAIDMHGKELTGSIRMEPRFVPVDYTGHKQILPPLVPGHPLNHWQQGLTMRGEILLDGVSYPIDALGFRTRTWGFRDDSMQFLEYFSLFACFEDFDVSIMKFRQPDGSMRTDGALIRRDGSSVRFDEIHITRDSAGSPLKLVLDLVDGSKLELKRLQRTADMWCPIGPPERDGPTFCAFDEFIEWESADGQRGYGLNEQAIIRFVC